MRVRGSGELRAAGAPGALRAAALAALAALCALRDPSAESAFAPDDHSLYALPGNYCDLLQNKLGAGPERRDVVLPLQLVGGGAAAVAAHALLQALLVRGVRVPKAKVQLRRGAGGDAFCAFLDHMANITATWRHKVYELPLTVAAAWHGERCDMVPKFEEGLGGAWLDVHGGRAPAARRLHARRAAAAAAACAAWPDLLRADCQFLAPPDARLPGELTPPSNWPNCTCSSSDTACINVLVAVDAHDAGATARLAEELCARAARRRPPPPLRLVPLRDAGLRRALRHQRGSFLFVDYDWWNGSVAERVQLAPPLPYTDFEPRGFEYAIPMFVAPTKYIKYYVPPAMCVLDKFQPPAAMLRRVLRNEPALGLAEAACEAVLAAPSLDEVRGWIECPENDVVVYVQTCGEENNDFQKHITDIVFKHWELNKTTQIKISLDFAKVVSCDDVVTPNDQFEKWTGNWVVSQLLGAVVMGSGGAGLLAKALADRHVPLLLGDAPEGDSQIPGSKHWVEDTCVVSPDGARLLAALRWLLARCGWRRAAVLREATRAAKWQNFSIAYDNETVLALRHQILGPEGAAPALAALRTRDARVVVLDAGAAAAADVLRQAERAGMAPAAGYAWLVLRAAGEGAAWRPRTAAFEYVTLSGWWRDGAAPAGQPALRDDLANATLFPSLPARAAPLVDALLMMMTGIEYLLETQPRARHEPTDDRRRLVLERLRNVPVTGVASEQRCGAARDVFVHRWRAGGGRLLASWPAAAGSAAAAPCGRLRDAAPCRTTRSGDPYWPTCHDAAWVVLLCALVLAPPALCAAAAARRARLRRRDRALERRLLARGGRSQAAAAALAEHAVPRAALELMDELGVGHYGSVRLAVLRTPDRAPLAVAAKTPRVDAAAEAETELLCEAALLATLRHDHVVRFAGVCFEGAPLVLMEHAFHGDLRRYLRARRPMLERARAGQPEPEAEHVGAAALTRLAREAAAALGYLAHQRLVHRDVRAANCLVDARRSLKLADFGMARRLDEAGEAGGAGAGEYLCRRRALFPVLWMAPESLARGVFSPATDVWGLGVLMLELATLGARPFGAWPAPRAVRHVRAGGAPLLPPDAAPSTRGVAATCWRRAAAERPSAAQLVAYLATHARALRPALAPLEGDAGAAPAPADSENNFYCDEWTA